MSKKREGDDNWFMLPPQERGALMKSHGELGKTYLDVLSEFTTGGCGLDDWEWGITIFSNDDIQFKKIVYDMRFEVAVQNMVSSATSTLVPSSTTHY